MVMTSMGVFLVVGLLSAYLTQRHLTVERERKAATKALSLSEEKFRLISSSALDGIVMMDPDGKVSFWNDAATKIFGYSQAEVKGRDLHELLALPEHLGCLNDAKEQFCKEGTGNAVGKTLELTAVRKDRETIPVELSVSAFNLEGKWHAVGVVRDISERTRMKAEKRQTETLISEAIEHLPAGILIAQTKGRRLLHANAAAKALLGEVSGDYLDLDEQMDEQSENKRKIKLFDAKGHCIDPIDYPLNKATIRGITTAGSRCILEKDNGERIWIEISAAPVRGENGETIYGVVVITDISERIRAEKEKSLLEEQLQQARKMEAIGTLAGGLAHDFNNILLILLGNAELALMRNASGEDIDGALNEVRAAGLRARDLVQQILDFSRQTVKKKQPVVIASVLAETIVVLRTAIPSSVQLHIDVNANRSAVFADPSNIHQIIMNLCTNAVQAMGDAGGDLRISLKETDVDVTTFPLRRDLMPGRYLELGVMDTGHGMTPEIMDRIFEPYFTTKRGGEGTGIGLSLVYSIVKDAGGAIHVESEPGKGSRFTLFFPVHAGDMAFLTAEETDSIPLGRGHVLIVDDEYGITSACRSMLRKIGYWVTPVNDAQEAFEIFRGDPNGFDLVITDLTMPRMSGIELARRMKSIRPEIPIVLLTGFSDLGKADYKTYGFDYLLMKPPILKDLSNVMRAALNDGNWDRLTKSG
jgi:PAS domain S-box-containing protein